MGPLGRYISLPLRRQPVFFAALTALLSVAPIWATIFGGGHIYRFMVACVLESMTIAYLASVVLMICRRFSTPLKWLVLALAAAWAFAECVSIGTTGMPVDQAVVSLVCDTDATEVSGFFSRYLGWRAVLAIIALPVYVSLVIAIVLYLRRIQLVRRVAAIGALAGVAVGAVLICRIGSFLPVRTYEDLLVWVGQGSDNPELIRYYELNYTPAPVKAAYISKINRLENRDITEFDRKQTEIYRTATVTADTTRRFNVLVIIGESMIRRHSSLYGYRLRTNPVLEAERDSGHLVVFSDIMTTANYTTTAIHNLLSTADLDRGQRWTDGAYFPMLLKRGGMEVSIFDNQLTDARTDTGLGRVLYSPLNLTEVYSAVGDSLFDFDGAFATYANSRVRPDSLRRQCVIYHLKGQHFDAADRFDTAPHFTAADITEPAWLTAAQRQDIADYDSATFYNDSVVGALLRPWTNVPTLAFYFSDHGEDIADLGETGARNRPRPDDPEWVDRQFHVPFVAWMSPSFQARYPALADTIRQSAGRPESLDHLGEHILSLLGIDYHLKQ